MLNVLDILLLDRKRNFLKILLFFEILLFVQLGQFLVGQDIVGQLTVLDILLLDKQNLSGLFIAWKVNIFIKFYCLYSLDSLFIVGWFIGQFIVGWFVGQFKLLDSS